MFVLGTAGHVDHGKSALVHRLTGIDPDRLAEEKRRGMTIDLGFAWFDLPSGHAVSVVDVPGHERFVRTMLAGAGGIDLALLVIAADEGVMPQTREHLAILGLLGINYGVVAVTKTDLVDEEWRQLVTDDIRLALRQTRMAGAPIVPVCTPSGQGIPELIDTINSVAVSLPARQSLSPFWFPIDRAFGVAGFGPVVTGTLHGSALHVGDEVECLPDGVRGRVRGLQMHRNAVEQAEPGTRVAVNLTGEAAAHARRGMVLASPNTVLAVSRFLARVNVPAGAATRLEPDSVLTLHIGAAETPARVRSLDGLAVEAHQSAWAEIRPERPTPVIRGQHFVLRLPSPVGTIAGGVVVEPEPAHRGLRSHNHVRLELLAGTNVCDVVRGLLLDGRRRRVDDIARITGFRLEIVNNAVEHLLNSTQIVRAGATICSVESWDALLAQARVQVDAFHIRYPLRPGIPAEELRHRLRLLTSEWDHLLHGLIEAQVVRIEGTMIAAWGRPSAIESRAADAEQIVSALAASPFTPPSSSDLFGGHAVDHDLLAALVRAGRIVRLNFDHYMARSAFDQMLESTLKRIASAGSVSVVEIREEFRTSRKYVLAFFEYLDDQRITRRVGDVRILGSVKAPCA